MRRSIVVSYIKLLQLQLRLFVKRSQRMQQREDVTSVSTGHRSTVYMGTGWGTGGGGGAESSEREFCFAAVRRAAHVLFPEDATEWMLGC
jgi:hypothetical protein